MSNETEAKAGEFLPALVDPRVEEARAEVRALLAPTGRDLEALLMRLHEQSALSQQKARKSQQKARDEINKRLEGKLAELDETGAVVVTIVTTRELIGVMEAEANLIKVEALSQRSYDFHRLASVTERPKAGGVESFIDQLEQDEQTAGEPAPTDP